MSNDNQESVNDDERTTSKKSKPWFRTTRAGVGWIPQSWQGWLVLLAIVAAVVVIVVLVRNG
jgi:hypothetical protein